MTLEEKIAQIRNSSMEQARAESDEIITSYERALEKVLEDHKAEARRQAQTRRKAEITNAKQEKNQAMARAQFDLKRQQGKVQQELKDRIFAEAHELVRSYMETGEYEEFLVRCIQGAMQFAAGDEVTLYINPSDEAKKDVLERLTGAALTVSAEDFIGGMRAVIRKRNVLIDHSFKTGLANEYEQFMFQGGEELG